MIVFECSQQELTLNAYTCSWDFSNETLLVRHYKRWRQLLGIVAAVYLTDSNPFLLSQTKIENKVSTQLCQQKLKLSTS